MNLFCVLIGHKVQDSKTYDETPVGTHCQRCNTPVPRNYLCKKHGHNNKVKYIENRFNSGAIDAQSPYHEVRHYKCIRCDYEHEQMTEDTCGHG